jgi:hypothetical protein
VVIAALEDIHDGVGEDRIGEGGLSRLWEAAGQSREGGRMHHAPFRCRVMLVEGRTESYNGRANGRVRGHDEVVKTRRRGGGNRESDIIEAGRSNCQVRC